MTAGDYTQLADAEIHFDAPDPEKNRWRSQLKTSSEVQMWELRDAKPANRHYPVLIYAPRATQKKVGVHDPTEILPVDCSRHYPHQQALL